MILVNLKKVDVICRKVDLMCAQLKKKTSLRLRSIRPLVPFSAKVSQGRSPVVDFDWQEEEKEEEEGGEYMMVGSSCGAPLYSI